MAGDPDNNHELEGRKANISFKCRFSISDLESEIFSAKETEKKEEEKRQQGF